MTPRPEPNLNRPTGLATASCYTCVEAAPRSGRGQGRCATLGPVPPGRAASIASAALLRGSAVGAAVPVTPSNIGVFQAACVAVLGAAYGVPATQPLAYGVVLQVVEVATAILMGAPALLREGLLRRRGPSIAVEAVPR